MATRIDHRALAVSKLRQADAVMAEIHERQKRIEEAREKMRPREVRNLEEEQQAAWNERRRLLGEYHREYGLAVYGPQKGRR